MGSEQVKLLEKSKKAANSPRPADLLERPRFAGRKVTFSAGRFMGAFWTGCGSVAFERLDAEQEFPEVR